MNKESLETYLSNVEKRTGAKFEVLVGPEERFTNNGYDGDDSRYYDHRYISAKVQLVGTKFTMALIWSGTRWKRGRG